MPFNPAWTDHDIRQYRHIVDSTGSKRIAAGAVNNILKKQAARGKGRRRRKKGG
jgi:hypothetical protein